ncbi:hypothetical protein OIU74_012695 [Salix koriyanagi]|uniref:Uncharacterized protein n=1 Tax=Salix koriyanagi TaxID=2511006 RepID=A0A9Q0Q857_9ROSI|nr:hypothetical protein OIU74_012695 [Salix koriyanagi]
MTVVEAVEKGLVKRWVPVKKVIPDQVKSIEPQLSDEPSRPTNCEDPSRPTNCEDASRPTNCGQQFRPNDMQVSSPLNESLDAQRSGGSRLFGGHRCGPALWYDHAEWYSAIR